MNPTGSKSFNPSTDTKKQTDDRLSQSAPALLPSWPKLPEACRKVFEADKGTYATTPCLMVWLPEGRLQNSLVSAVTFQAVGHVSAWIGSNLENGHEPYDNEQYVSWWPASAGAGFSMSDISGPAKNNNFAADVKAEGRMPDIVVPLIGFESANMMMYFHGEATKEYRYRVLDRNCACMVFDVLRNGVASGSTGSKATTALIQSNAEKIWRPEQAKEFANLFVSMINECQGCLHGVCKLTEHSFATKVADIASKKEQPSLKRANSAPILRSKGTGKSADDQRRKTGTL